MYNNLNSCCLCPCYVLNNTPVSLSALHFCRMAIRNAKRADESLTAITAEHNKELGALKNKIKSLKVDNNLLMVTIKR